MTPTTDTIVPLMEQAEFLSHVLFELTDTLNQRDDLSFHDEPDPDDDAPIPYGVLEDVRWIAKYLPRANMTQARFDEIKKELTPRLHKASGYSET